MKRVHLVFYGSVQGVFFRQKTKEKADSLNINGWVKNLSDGTKKSKKIFGATDFKKSVSSVEAVFEGEKVDSLIEYCKTIGKVEKVDIKEDNENKIIFKHTDSKSVEKIKKEKGFVIIR